MNAPHMHQGSTRRACESAHASRSKFCTGRVATRASRPMHRSSARVALTMTDPSCPVARKEQMSAAPPARRLLRTRPASADARSALVPLLHLSKSSSDAATAPSMHPGTPAVMPRTSGALLLSAVEANVAEFWRRTPAPDGGRCGGGRRAAALASAVRLAALLGAGDPDGPGGDRGRGDRRCGVSDTHHHSS